MEMERKASFKDRAFDKLGITSIRAKAHSFDSQILSDIRSATTSLVSPLSAITDNYVPPRRPLSMTDVPDTKADVLGSDNIITDNANSSDVTDNMMVQERKISRPQPAGTITHVVDFSETLQSIAAHYDVTPSELAKLNRLTSRTIFPGQSLFVPGEDYVSAQSISPPEHSPTHAHKMSDPFNRKSVDLPMVTMQENAPPLKKKVPGHAQRLTPTTSPTHKEASPPITKPAPKPSLPRQLTDAEAKSLDQECHERFIKVNVKYITDGQGVIEGTLLVTPNALMFDPNVSDPLVIELIPACFDGVIEGTLLVTPNALMFDPNVSDPLVIERGTACYGMIAQMETIISATLYHDIAAMNRDRSHERTDPDHPKHEIYYGSGIDNGKRLSGSENDTNSPNDVLNNGDNTNKPDDKSIGKSDDNTGATDTVVLREKGDKSADSIVRDEISNSMEVVRKSEIIKMEEMREEALGNSMEIVSQSDIVEIQDDVDKYGDIYPTKKTAKIKRCSPKKSSKIFEADSLRDSTHEILGSESQSLLTDDIKTDTLAHFVAGTVQTEQTDEQTQQVDKTVDKIKTVNKTVDNTQSNLPKTLHRISDTSVSTRVKSGVFTEPGSEMVNAQTESCTISTKDVPTDKTNKDITTDKPPDLIKDKLREEICDKSRDVITDKSPDNKSPVITTYNLTDDEKNVQQKKSDSSDIDSEVFTDKDDANTRLLTTENVFNFDKENTKNLDESTTTTGSSSSARSSGVFSSSINSIAQSPHINTFVNYATGLFRNTSDDRSIVKDITDVVTKIPDAIQSGGSTLISGASKIPDAIQSGSSSLISGAAKIPDVIQSGSSSLITGASKIPDAIQTGGSNLISGGSSLLSSLMHDGSGVTDTKNNVSKNEPDIAVQNAVKIDDMPGLFQSFDVLIPKQASPYFDPPLYLNIHVGEPINKQPCSTCVIEAYGNKKKKPEYWFSIPRDKVDQLYAFFVQWSPDKYGDADDFDPAERGFVVITDDHDGSSLDIFTDYFGDNSPHVTRDWEIVSHRELLRRQSIFEPLTSPELIGTSVVLSTDDVDAICPFLPARAVGYSWTLVYSTEEHGFSLKTLYRNMHGLDCPVLLAVKDTTHNVFGALASVPFKVSEHFYGTGESFLYRFAPEFELYKWTGQNNFFIKGNMASLAIGAGKSVDVTVEDLQSCGIHSIAEAAISGIFGLWFDGDLYHGCSHPCDTYNNDVLSDTEDFVVQALEAWAFIDT